LNLSERFFWSKCSIRVSMSVFPYSWTTLSTLHRTELCPWQSHHLLYWTEIQFHHTIWSFIPVTHDDDNLNVSINLPLVIWSKDKTWVFFTCWITTKKTLLTNFEIILGISFNYLEVVPRPILQHVQFLLRIMLRFVPSYFVNGVVKSASL
jgi:hypothetical protein